MKILVIGAGGMVASHLIDLLLEKGHKVYGTIRWNEDLSNIQHCKEKINLEEMDLTDFISVLRVIEKVKPDAISLLGAESYVSASFEKPSATISVNTLGTLNLLEAIRIVRDKYAKKQFAGEAINQYPKTLFFDPVIHICSSSEVYGLVKKEDIPIKETQNFNPANPYAVGKVGADMLALMYYTNYGLKTIRTRMFSHTSRRRKMLSAEVNFAMQIATFEEHYSKVRQNAKYLLKHGNLNSLRTWAHVEDAVNAYYLILTKPVKFGEVYNIGGIDSRTIGEVLNKLLDLSPIKYKIKTELDQNLLRKYDVTLQLPDISKFQKDYPEWKAKWRFEEIMFDVLEGQRECLKKRE